MCMISGSELGPQLSGIVFPPSMRFVSIVMPSSEPENISALSSSMPLARVSIKDSVISLSSFAASNPPLLFNKLVPEKCISPQSLVCVECHERKTYASMASFEMVIPFETMELTESLVVPRVFAFSLLPQ